MNSFNALWRQQKYAAFDLENNSSARATIEVDIAGRRREVYANANLSIYSGQTCNARCPFCVEELRPASRGLALAVQKQLEADDERYFAALDRALDAVAPISPSVSLTGGEASLDPRLPRLLATLRRRGLRKRTLTSNGSGVAGPSRRPEAHQAVLAAGLAHFNLSRAHPDDARNVRLMRAADLPPATAIATLAAELKAVGTRTRLSCVLLRDGIADPDAVLAYLDFAAAIGIDNVVFRQLMLTDRQTSVANAVVRYSARQRVSLDTVLPAPEKPRAFTFIKQVLGYYYYVEVWRYRGIDVAFEAADLSRLEDEKRRHPRRVHEFVFHPGGELCSTWQPWDGVLLAPSREATGGDGVSEGAWAGLLAAL